MQAVKLTLSADKNLIRIAKRIARARKTSVSALFADHIKELAVTEAARMKDIGPLTRQASGIVRLPKNRTDRELLEQALWEKDISGK